MIDALLRAVVDAPDDDAPRLVWADREGGERGELVVIQCALARHELPLRERERLAAREAELLQKYASAWTSARNATFVRGFVEEVRIGLDDLASQVEALFEREPLLRGLRFMNVTEGTNAFDGPRADASWANAEAKLRDVFRRVPPGRLRALSIDAAVHEQGDWASSGRTYHFDAQLLAVLAEAPSLSSLRELTLSSDDITPAHIPAFARLNLERLHLYGHRLGGDGVVRLLREAPSLVRLKARYGQPPLNRERLEAVLASPDLARMRELDLARNYLGPSDLQHIAECPALANLEVLGVAGAAAGGARFLGASPHLANLRELDLQGVEDADLALAAPTFARSLRVLRLSPKHHRLALEHLTALEHVDRCSH